MSNKSPYTDSKAVFKSRYENYIGGEWVAPVGGKYAQNKTSINGQILCEVPQSCEKDVEKALDIAHKAAHSWGKTSAVERATLLLKIADRIEANLDKLAHAETWDNGKPIRETTAADIPLAADHFRYFASCVRTQEGSLSDIDDDSVAYHFHEPLGVVGQIIPWNFPILMAAWKLAPALAAGNCVVLKPASATPASILVLFELIGDLLPAGVVSIINGSGNKIGKYLATNPKIAKVAFTGSTSVGRQIMQFATENIIPCTLELGGKSPNIFFPDIYEYEDAFLDKAVEGVVLFAFNQGEVCTCPSRALIHEKIYDKFMEKVLERVKAIKAGCPLDPTTMLGAQVDENQVNTIMNYIKIGKDEGAECLIGGEKNDLGGELSKGCYVKPTIFKGHNKMKIFQEEIFGPVLAVTTFKDECEAMQIANDSIYGLGAGVWTRDINRAYRFGRGIKAGRVWTNCYHAYPAHAAFGGYKQSGIGRETHKIMLDHYQQVKNIYVSYSPNKLGFF